MTPVLAVRRTDYVRRFAELFHRGGIARQLAPEPLGPPLEVCPACMVDDSSTKVITTIEQFYDHIIRHTRRLWCQ